MRAFIVLCLVAVACADRLGYNYQPVGHSNSGLSFAPGSVGDGHGGLGDIGGLGGTGGSGGLGDLSGNGGLGDIGATGGNEGLGSSPFSGDLGGNAGDSFDGPSSYSAPAELEKEFYTFSAPEHEFEDANAAQRAANGVKQGLRVVFIKGPENKGLEDAALALAKQAANQHTDIYVLNKQADIGDLANKLNNINKNANNKPEVHFVKYRTPEDAANAQRAIQDQYDSLGGNSKNINGGNAPVLNFASQYHFTGPSAFVPRNSYLPSSVLRH